MPLKSDPGRLPRRNHYQEGPGFLFLATQGGRPPGSVAPGASAGIIRRRASALRRWRDGEPIAGLCAELGVHLATLFRWRSRFEEAGLVGLADPVHVGRASTLDPILERVILTVRLLTNWSSRRIAAEFDRRDAVPAASVRAVCPCLPLADETMDRAPVERQRRRTRLPSGIPGRVRPRGAARAPWLRSPDLATVGALLPPR